MSALTELLERVRGATEGSRELDAMIARFFNEPNGPWEEVDVDSRSIYSCDEIAAPYSTSIDAAVALVEKTLPDWEWTLWCGGSATLAPHAQSSYHLHVDADGETPALALCAALLAALAAMEGRDG